MAVAASPPGATDGKLGHGISPLRTGFTLRAILKGLPAREVPITAFRTRETVHECRVANAPKAKYELPAGPRTRVARTRSLAGLPGAT